MLIYNTLFSSFHFQLFSSEFRNKIAFPPEMKQSAPSHYSSKLDRSSGLIIFWDDFVSSWTSQCWIRTLFSRIWRRSAFYFWKNN